MNDADSDPLDKSDNPYIDLSLIIEAEEWNKTECDIHKLLLKITKLLASFIKLDKATDNFALSVLLTNDKKMQELNNDFRGINKPTNTLSFPQFEELDLNLEFIKNSPPPQYLGDIAISYEKIFDEAMEHKITFIDHLTHIYTHSFLHLLGYDHIKEDEAENMMNVEIQFLKTISIQNPYN